MKPKVKDIEKWCKALRSGKYKQGKGMLQRGDEFCCMGVACKIFIPKHKLLIEHGDITGDFPSRQTHSPGWLAMINNDFTLKTGDSLSTINDSGAIIGLDSLGLNYRQPVSFDEIADLLEAVYVHKVLD